MKTLNLRDANQQFSKLVREIEATGETVLVLRDGKPAIRMMPVEEKLRRFSVERLKAIESLLESARNNRSGSDPNLPPMTRDEMHER
jgi:prevent-host-death family protein